MRYIRKILISLIYTLSALLLMVVIFLMLLQNGTLNNMLASLLARQGSKNLNAEVNIGNIQGNPLNLFSINDIEINRNDSTVLHMQRLHLNYNLTAVLQKELRIRNLEVGKLVLNGTQYPDSAWNFMKVLPEPERQEKKKDSLQSEWHISVNRLLLDSLNARLKSLPNSNIPSNIQVNGLMDFSMLGDSIVLGMADFSMETGSPDLKIEQLMGNFRKVREKLSWDNLTINLEETNLRSQGSLSLEDLSELQGNMIFDPLRMEDFHPWMKDMKLYGSPVIKIAITGKGPEKEMDLRLQEGKQKVSLTGTVKDLNSSPNYSFTMAMDGIRGEYWTQKPEYRSRVEGKLTVSGRGFDFRDNSVSINGTFRDLIYGDYDADHLVLRIDKKQERIKGNMKTTTRFGNINSRFSLNNTFREPEYSVQADLAHVDLSKFPGNKELQSDLNLSLKTSGKGTDPDSMNTNVDLDIKDSHFLDKPVKAVNVALQYDRGSYSLSNFRLKSDYADIQARGEGHIREKHSLTYEVRPKDLKPLHEITGFPMIDIQGNISGSVGGTRDSLNLAAEYDFFNVHYDTLKASRFQGNLSVLSRDSLINGKIDVTVDSAFLNNRTIEQISLNSSYNNNLLKNRIQLTVNDTLSLFTQTDVRTMDDPVFTIHELQLNMDDEVWQSGTDSTRITMGKDSILIDDFRLRSGEQIIGLNGTLALKGQENLNFRLENLDISRLPQSGNPGSQIHGIANSEIHLGGSAASPELKGNLNIEHPGMDTIHFERFTSNFQYVSDTLNFQGNMDLKFGRPLQANLTMPLSFSLTDSFSMPNRNTPVRASLKLDSLELQSINPFLDNDNMVVSGLIDAGVDLSNTIGEPRFDGKLQLKKGAFSYPEQGISYRDIKIDSRFDNQRFVLDQASIRSGGGNLKMEGYAGMGFSEGKDNQALLFKIDGKKFRAVRSEKLEAYIDPSINIKGTLTDPDVAGNVNVSLSRINADAFRRQFSFRSDNPNPPLLVKAMRDTSEKKGNLQPLSEQNKPSPDNILKNLNLNLNLTIPGNTWVRGNDMNFELSGNLRAIMKAEQIDLFGTLNIQRGFFEFYGKKFDFLEGSLTLTGGREIDPLLNLILGYDFRDPERELHTLTLRIEGRTSQPELSFLLDGENIQEKEAFSYLLFGKAPGRLTAGEQMSLEENAADIARSLAIGKVTGIVTGSLKSSLGLDVVEVGGGKTWKSGSVKIGKYITEDLYLSYKQTFAFDKREKVIEPERITLDYQLTRSLFLQATNQMPNSGFDLIFKKSWK